MNALGEEVEINGEFSVLLNISIARDCSLLLFVVAVLMGNCTLLKFKGTLSLCGI